MATYKPPLEILPIFDSDIFNTDPLIINYNNIRLLYATYPISSTNQTLNNIIVNNTLSIAGPGSLSISNPVTFSAISALTSATSSYNISTSNNISTGQINITGGSFILDGTTIVSGTSTFNCPIYFNDMTITPGYQSTIVSSSPTTISTSLSCIDLTLTGSSSAIPFNTISASTNGNVLSNINAYVLNGSVNMGIKYPFCLAKCSSRPPSTLGGIITFLGNTNYNFNTTSSLVDSASTAIYNYVFSTALLTNTYIVMVYASYSASTIGVVPLVYNKTITGFSIQTNQSGSSGGATVNITGSTAWLDIMVY